jgi:hypothetical protein
MKYAQLNSQLKFISKSNIQDYFYAMILDDDADSMKPLVEYILYNLIAKEGFEEDIAQIFVLPTKGHEELKMDEFGKLTKDLKINTEDVIRSVHEEASISTDGKPLSIEKINKIAKAVMAETSDGLMLYFGAQNT